MQNTHHTLKLLTFRTVLVTYHFGNFFIFIFSQEGRAESEWAGPGLIDQNPTPNPIAI